MADYTDRPLGAMSVDVPLRAHIRIPGRDVKISGHDFGPIIEVGRTGVFAIWKKVGASQYLDRGAGSEYQPTEYWLIEGGVGGGEFIIRHAVFAKGNMPIVNGWREKYEIANHPVEVKPKRKPGRPPMGTAPKQQAPIMLDADVKEWAQKRAGDGSLSATINTILKAAMAADKRKG